jgi:hypothetical protein
VVTALYSQRSQEENLMRHLLCGIASVGLLLALAVPVRAAGADTTAFVRVAPQYIAALGDPGATSGSNAQTWGLWRVDPGPRGVPLYLYDRLMQVGGVAPANWKFDSKDWWLEEHGLIMEKPTFPLAPGRYLVTGDRDIASVLTVHRPDASGHARWELADGATLHDVTHLACRSARYTPAGGAKACTPAQAPRSAFRVAPGLPMPGVDGCTKQDYEVLIVIGVAAENASAKR